MKSGSPFFAEMRRITSSLRPGATLSWSISVTKPYWYSWSAMAWIVALSAMCMSRLDWGFGEQNGGFYIKNRGLPKKRTPR